MNDKVLSMLGLCRRAGKISLGFDAAGDAVSRGTAKLVVLASDLSPRTKKSILLICGEYDVPVAELAKTMDDIGGAIGKRVGIAAVNDLGFSQKIRELIALKNEEECPYDDKV